jgi:hypothetical protein
MCILLKLSVMLMHVDPSHIACNVKNYICVIRDVNCAVCNFEKSNSSVAFAVFLCII